MQVPGYSCEGLFLFFGFFFLIKSLKVGGPIFNLYLLRWEDPPIIWAMLSAENLDNRRVRRTLAPSACWFSLLLTCVFLHQLRV